MADEEVDVLGDFENYLSKSPEYGDNSLVSQNSDILDDYTMNSQWMSERPTTNLALYYLSSESWYNSAATEKHDSVLNTSSVPKLKTEYDNWSDKEKMLLEKAIEIFGKDQIHLSRFIGTKTPSEVKHYLDNYYTGIKLYSEDIIINTDGDILVSEVLADIEIPTCIEEVIDSVSTGKPTIECTKGKSLPQKLCTNAESYSDTESITTNFKNDNAKRVKSRIIPKKNTKLKVGTHTKNVRTAKVVHQSKKQQIAKVKHDVNANLESNMVEITTGNGLSVPLSEGEEIVTISKEVSNDDSDIDLEIDVEDDEDHAVREKLVERNSNITQSTKDDNINHHAVVLKNNDTSYKENELVCEDSVLDIDGMSLSSTTTHQLKSLESPTQEYLINKEYVSEIERVFNPDFFASTGKKTSKTPERYIKIRNFILDVWESSQPSYVTKTSLRQGLRNCGDVNCIGRIHSFLEQIGAINFGCEQVKYVRPIYQLLKLKSIVRGKGANSVRNDEPYMESLGPRKRFRKKFMNEGEGGCTIAHDEKGDIISTVVVDEKPPVKRPYNKKPHIQLISCRPFTREMPQTYKVVLNLSALISMDFHAHTSLSEVMGFVAGSWDPVTKTLTILSYEPCKNLASSSTHCEMCPISQAKAAENIHNQGLEVLGWFHSHPTFAPEPSQQDIDTQLCLQYSIGCNKPCVGVILSPFTESYSYSQLRCLVVEKRSKFDDQMVPYKLKIDLKSTGFDLDKCVNDIWKIYSTVLSEPCDDSLDFGNIFPLDTSTTLLDRFAENLRIQLSKFDDLHKRTSGEIVNRIYGLFKQ